MTSVESAAARGAILALLGVACFWTGGCDGPDRPRRSGSRDLVHRPDGVVDIPFGWPLRYSHSPVEVIDLEDLDVLSDWIRAIVEGW